MTFHVGQKVVCVDDRWIGDWFPWEYIPNRPRKGDIYTIRGVEFFEEGENGLYLMEVVNPFCDWDNGYLEACFGVSRFRPVTERKTDISIFQEILTNIPQDVEFSA